MNMQRAMKSPGAVFVTPEVLDASTEFSSEQKLAILRQWKDQLEKLLIAEDESMLAPALKSGGNAECLRRVTDLLTRLDSHLG